MIDVTSKIWDVTKYPENWKMLSLMCRNRANNRCEICNVVNGTDRVSHAGNIYKVRLAGCHINVGDEWNPNPELFAGCQTCHARYDSAYKRMIIALNIRALKAVSPEIRQAQYEQIIATVKASIQVLDRATFLNLYGYKAA